MFDNINDFTADQFTPTKWDSAEEKAAFAKKFITFVEADFGQTQFPKAFYKRLSMTFGNIAHYDQGGFYEFFFTTTRDKVRFLRQTLQHPCYGCPTFTYSDVEKALQCWLRQNDVLARYEKRLAQEQEAAERAVLASLQAKYGKENQ